METEFKLESGIRPGLIVGEGPTVIAVHGALLDHRIWRPTATRLADDFRVLAYTQRGFGAEAGRPLDLAEHVADLVEIAEQQGGRVHVLGWSYGGAVGLRAIAERPDLFASAAFFDPSANEIMAGDADFERVEAPFRDQLAAALELWNQGRFEAAVGSFAEAVTGVRRSPEEAPALFRIVADNAATIPTFLGMAPRIPPGISEVGTRALVLNGGSSPLRYRMIGSRLAEGLPRGSHGVLARTTHDAPAVAPEAWVTALRPFLQALVLDGERAAA